MKTAYRWIMPVSIIVMVLLPVSCRKDPVQPTSVCTVTAPSPDLHPRAQIYQDVMDEYVTRGLPGMTLLIRDKDGLWYGASGMADIAEKINMQPCHVSKAASITKIFIGALVMKLVEEDKINLDAPLTRYVDAKYTRKVANAGDVTLRQLLNHTSGIPDLIEQNSFYLAVLNNPSKFWKPEELLSYVYGLDALFEPGEQLEYSNTNLLLAVMAIEGATGMNHADLLREKVIVPLGLNSTFYHWHDALPGLVAQGYYDLYNNGTLVEMSNFNTGSGNGYGGIYSTVFDLQVFIEALLRDRTLLSPASLAEMITLTAEDIPDQEGYGVTIRKDFYDRDPAEYALGHRGRDLAYTGDLFYFPNQDATLVCLINYGTDGDSGLKDVFLAFRKAIVDEILK